MTNLPQILHLVDTIEYAESNCFQHQLMHALRDVARVQHCSLAGLERAFDHGPLPVVCCLKQRTVHANLDRLAKAIGDAPIVIYDQDPWESYRDGSPYKGVYQRAVQQLNVKGIALTTQIWADRFFHDKLPSKFVRMWVKPEYCERGPSYEERSVNLGFVGALHPYRRELFDALDDMGVQVNVQTGGLGYSQFLQQLNNIRIYVHREEASVIIDGDAHMDLKDGLWIKDIEAAARGCFSIRNAGAGYLSYCQELPRDSQGHRLVRLYRKPEEIPGIIESIEKMDPVERQSLIDRTVEYIRAANVWHETARTLVETACTEEGRMGA